MFVFLFGIVYRVVQTAALLALHGLAGDQVAHVDHVAQFAYLLIGLHALEEVFGLFVEQVQTFPRTTQTQVAAYDAYVGGHDLAHLAHVLCDQHALFVRERTLVVPFGHRLVPIVCIYHAQAVTRCRVGIYHSLYQRVAGQSVAAMQAGAGALAYGIQTMDRTLAIQVHLDTAAHIVCARGYGYIVLRDVYSDAQALGIDIGEVVFRLLGIFVGHVQTDMIYRVDFHLVVYRAGHDVTRRQTQTRVVFLHKLLAVRQTQYAAVAAHGFGDQVGWMRLLRIKEAGRVELHKLHVLHHALGAIDHRYAVAGSYLGIGGRGIYSPRTTRSHQRDAAEERVDLLRLGIQYVGAVALDVRRTARDAHTQVVLRDDLYGKVVLQHVDIRILAHRSHQSALYLGARIVGMVQDAELGVTALAVQVKAAILFLVEVHAPLHQFLDGTRRIAYHLLHGLRIAQPVARHHRVVDVFLKIIHLQVGHRGDTALRLGRVGLFQAGLTA